MNMFKHVMRTVLGATALAVLLSVAVPSTARAVESQALTINTDDLEAVSSPGRVQSVGKVEVVEFFWYGCPHCNAIHQQLDGWAKTLPADVTFIRLPVDITEHDEAQQRLYFTLEALGRLDLHHQVFVDIHSNKKKLTSASAIATSAPPHALAPTAWRDAYNSGATKAKVAAAQAAFERFGLNGVPVIVINGRAAIPAGNLDYAVPRANQLITQLLQQ